MRINVEKKNTKPKPNPRWSSRNSIQAIKPGFRAMLQSGAAALDGKAAPGLAAQPGRAAAGPEERLSIPALPFPSACPASLPPSSRRDRALKMGCSS